MPALPPIMSVVSFHSTPASVVFASVRMRSAARFAPALYFASRVRFAVSMSV